MSDFLVSYKILCDCEFGNTPHLALEYAAGENFMTYKGINRRDEPDFVGWTLVDGHINASSTIKYASVLCFNDTDLERFTQSYYREKYWNVLKCSDMLGDVANRIFVHSALLGTHTVALLTQMTAGALMDGKIGAKTLERIRSLSFFTLDFDTAITIHLTNKALGSPALAQNKDGWVNRVHKVATYD